MLHVYLCYIIDPSQKHGFKYSHMITIDANASQQVTSKVRMCSFARSVRFGLHFVIVCVCVFEDKANQMNMHGWHSRMCFQTALRPHRIGHTLDRVKTVSFDRFCAPSTSTEFRCESWYVNRSLMVCVCVGAMQSHVSGFCHYSHDPSKKPNASNSIKYLFRFEQTNYCWYQFCLHLTREWESVFSNEHTILFEIVIICDTTGLVYVRTT